MADDPLPPGDDTGNKRTRITCEFCESSLSASGDVLKIGGKAKAYRDSDSAIEKLNDRIAALDAEIVTLKSDLEAARATKPADVRPSRGGFLSDD